MTMLVATGLAMLALITCASSVGAAEAAAPQESPPSLSALSTSLSNAQAMVTQRIQAQADPEEALADQYAKLQTLCAAKFQALDADQKRYAAAEARTNVIGSVIALVGSVTVYAPAKTVMMGLGISSSGSGTVSSGITQFFSKRSATDAASLASLQFQLAQVFDRYDAVDASTDAIGRRRGGILSRGTNICMGLTPAVDPSAKPETQTATVAATTPAAPAAAAPAPNAPASAPTT